MARNPRKAASFFFTPKACGYHLPGTAEFHARPFYWDKTLDHSVSLGEVVAISGAAASPNMGYHTSPLVAFLMTVFNVRLGWWIMNPRRDNWTPSSPNIALLPLLEELFAVADQTSKYVYLSDGGHFENLALYELIRRRCPYLICCDGEEDGKMQFGSLGGIIRKAWADFGVLITVEPAQIRRTKDGSSRMHWSVGNIDYNDGTKGKLLYFKSSLTGDEPTDVTQYHCENPAFPHESTGDQFFSEAQFESYRNLGHHVARSAFDRATDGVTGALPGTLEELYERLR